MRSKRGEAARLNHRDGLAPGRKAHSCTPPLPVLLPVPRSAAECCKALPMAAGAVETTGPSSAQLSQSRQAPALLPAAGG